jgi:hypothetical protein
MLCDAVVTLWGARAVWCYPSANLMIVGVAPVRLTAVSLSNEDLGVFKNSSPHVAPVLRHVIVCAMLRYVMLCVIIKFIAPVA